MSQGKPPIACTLTGGEFKTRLQWIATLMKDALRGQERRDLELTLRFAPEALERVRELVRREAACCGFLTFELHEAPNEIRVTITAPKEARLAVNTIFGQFVGSIRQGGSADAET